VRREWRLIPRTTSVAAVGLLLGAQFGALAGARPEPVEEMAALIRQHRVSNEAVAEYQAFVRNLVFYTRFKHTELYDDQGAIEFMRSPDRVLLVVPAADLGRLEAEGGLTMHTLARVDYLNAANLRLGTLLWPDRSRDVETVLLVTNRSK
jgi:hypothetical protein